MALYEVFSYSLRIRYKASLCSKTMLFYLLTTTLNIVLPFILIYSEGFWRSIEYYREQPEVSFKHKMILLLETEDLNQLLFWSTFKKLNELIPSEIQRAIPTIEHRQEDYNKDGKFDELLMVIDVPLENENVLSVKLLLIFDYKLHLHTKLQMESAAFVHYTSALPGSSFHILADLHTVQREPLIYSGMDVRYNVSIIDESRKDASYLKFENIFQQYTKRNVTTVLMNQYPVWKSGHVENNSFIINLAVKYPEQTILYKTQLWHLIKWFIIQYIGFFSIFLYIFYKIKMYAFRKNLVPAVVLSPMKQD